MKTSTKDITLCLNLDDSDHSPEYTSTLIDLWAELQLIAVEPSQAPTPNIFAFAETCLFFAIIMQNLKPDSGGDKPATAPEHARMGGDRRMFDMDAYPQSIDDASSSNVPTSVSFEGGVSQEYLAEPYDNRYATPWQLYGGVGHSAPTASSVPPPQVPVPQKAIGIIYVVASSQENVPAGEANIGIILVPEAREKDYAMQAGNLVLSWLFDEIGFHRVQTSVMDSVGKDWAITMFTQMGFVHEGTRRRSVFCPNEGVRGGWKDVTHLALLETDWLMRAYVKPAPKNLWDEMFLRHAREREELLRWDEKQQNMKRTSSMETLRVLNTLPSNAGSIAGSVDSTSRAATPSAHAGGSSRASSHAPSDSESDHSSQSWETEGWESDEAEGRFQRPFSHIPRHVPRSIPLTTGASSSSSSFSGASHHDSSPGSVPRSISPSSSQWDMAETSSVSSGFERIEDADVD